MALRRWTGRAIGLDVHRDFCMVAICEDGEVRVAGRVPSTPEGLMLLAQSLVKSDRVALEVTGSCWEVARILEPHVERVVVVSPDDTGIAQARAKTDRLDARALARLLWSGELESVWMPDERCRVLRRRLARREQLVHSRSRGSTPSRRARTCSGSKAASGWPASSCRSRSASPSRRGSVTSTSWTPRSPRSSG
jgi:transposase